MAAVAAVIAVAKLIGDGQVSLSNVLVHVWFPEAIATTRIHGVPSYGRCWNGKGNLDLRRRSFLQRPDNHWNLRI